MKRRDLFSLIAAVSALLPFPIVAQHTRVPVVGLLMGRSQHMAAHLAAAFREGLHETGFVESRNVIIEARHANGEFDRLPALARELVERRVDVIAAGWPSGHAAKAATSTTPI